MDIVAPIVPEVCEGDHRRFVRFLGAEGLEEKHFTMETPFDCAHSLRSGAGSGTEKS